MHFKSAFFVGLALTLVLSGCQKKDEKDDGVDSDGNCKYGFTYNYNKVVDATLSLEAAFNENPVKEDVVAAKQEDLKNTCSVMTANYKGISCSAKIIDGAAGEKLISANYEDLRPACQTVIKQMAVNNSQGKPTQKPFTGNETKRKIQPIKDYEFLTEQ